MYKSYFPDYVSDASSILDNLRTSVEAKMDVAASNLLSSLVLFVDGNASKQKALFKCEAADTIVKTLRDLVSVYVCMHV